MDISPFPPFLYHSACLVPSSLTTQQTFYAIGVACVRHQAPTISDVWSKVRDTSGVMEAVTVCSLDNAGMFAMVEKSPEESQVPKHMRMA